PGEVPGEVQRQGDDAQRAGGGGGGACRYGVNGDGTATDYDTELQWEQKTDDGSVHDKDNTYSWCVGGELPFPYCDNLANPPDGTAFTDFLGTLNNGTSGDGTTTSG